MANKTMGYARRALCSLRQRRLHLIDGPDKLLDGLTQNFDEDDVPVFYAMAAAWAGWIQNQQRQLERHCSTAGQDSDGVGGKPRSQLRQRHGASVSGVLETQLPPSLGGKPEAWARLFRTCH